MHTRLEPMPSRRRGFTLIELLVVIGIMTILIAILVPVIAKVRIAGYTTATKSEMQQISRAIDSYFADNSAYPGPIPESDLLSQYETPDKNQITPAPTGTENLVFGLLGGWSPSVPGYIATDVGRGAASWNPIPQYQTRSRAYTDTGNLLPGNASTWAPINPTGSPPDTAAPEFVDRFPARTGTRSPIIYLRCHAVSQAATGSLPVMCASDAGSGSTTPYYYDDGQLLPYGLNTMPGNFPINPATGAQDFANADAYFQGNGGVTNQPKHPGTYILISAGPDGILGTADDIFND